MTKGPTRNTSFPWAPAQSLADRSKKATTCSKASTAISQSMFTFPAARPRPEALLHAFMELQRKIDNQKLTGTNKAEHLSAAQPSEFPVPLFGAHDLEPPANPDVFHPPKIERTQSWNRWNKSKHVLSR